MFIANIIAYILVLLGAVNWGLVGIFDWNLVGAIFGGTRAVGSIIVYCIILVAALWLIISPFLTMGRLTFTRERQSASKLQPDEKQARQDSKKPKVGSLVDLNDQSWVFSETQQVKFH